MLDEKERINIEESAPFGTFLSSASGIIERVLGHAENFDPSVIYGSGAGDDDAGRDDHESRVVKVHTFFEPNVGGRAVTDISWSPHYKELFLSAYGSRAGDASDGFMSGGELGALGMGSGDGESEAYRSDAGESGKRSAAWSSDGLVLVWSLYRRKVPEFVFTCQSPVMTAKFDPFSTNLVVGATFSGQVVLWDKRAKSAPVQRTPLSAAGHTHPIFSLALVGSANANKLVTISTDGRLCAWSLGALSEPSDATMLSADSKTDVAVTALAFAAGDANEFCAGAEDGCVYAGQVHGQKSGMMKKYTGCHFGPVTALQFHPIPTSNALLSKGAAESGAAEATGGVGGGGTEGGEGGGAAEDGGIDSAGVGGGAAVEAISGKAKSLLLTSSVDWTVKLWSHTPRDAQHPLREIATFGSSREYVYDVQWSPLHPGLFCYVDGAGMLHLWNINRDTEEPIVRVQVTEDGKAGCNRVRWSHDGRKIIVGDSSGKTHLFDIASLVATPRSGAWGRLDAQVAMMRENA